MKAKNKILLEIQELTPIPSDTFIYYKFLDLYMKKTQHKLEAPFLGDNDVWYFFCCALKPYCVRFR